MIRIITENSTYLIEPSGDGGGLIKRTDGTHPPTECFEGDYWHRYVAMSFLEVGKNALVHWPEGAPHLASILSNVTKLEEVNP